jgi:hypothetical protein
MPGSEQLPIACQRLDARETWPVHWTVDHSLFAAILKDVLQSRWLSCLIGNNDRSIAASPESLAPIMEAADLAGNVAVHERDERRELSGVFNREQRVPVVGKHHEGVDSHREKELGSAEDSQDQVVDFGRRAKQEATMDGARGDFDDGSGRNVT